MGRIPDLPPRWHPASQLARSTTIDRQSSGLAIPKLAGRGPSTATCRSPAPAPCGRWTPRLAHCSSRGTGRWRRRVDLTRDDQPCSSIQSLYVVPIELNAGEGLGPMIISGSHGVPRPSRMKVT